MDRGAGTPEHAHVPVLLKETLELLDLKPGDHVVDATVGAGGHATAILSKTSPDGRLLGIDLDRAALDAAEETLKKYSDRCILVHGSFDDLTHIQNEHHFPIPRSIIADLGISSLELGDTSRGFSFHLTHSPLDMRFDASTDSESSPTAADLVNRLSERELEGILRAYGEEQHARTIARSIVKSRARKPFVTVGDLVSVIEAIIPRRSRIHPATRTFQALRIAVNDELGRLQRFLPQALQILAPGGRLAVISFHSLEDRMIKLFFRQQSSDGKVRILTKHPTTPSFAEVTTNPRSRSAKLRVVMRPRPSSSPQSP